MRISLWGSAPWDAALLPSVVQVFDAETRPCPPRQAAARLITATRLLVRNLGPTHLYKKVDSTLRGSIGAELEAILGITGDHAALLAPTFPATGRVVRDGVLYVDGRAVTETAIASDPVAPVRHARLVDIVEETSSLPVHVLALKSLRRGPSALANDLESMSSSGGIIAADAETEEDLTALARALATRHDILPCGSGGLASAFAAQWQAGRQQAATRRDPPLCDRIVVAVGSAHPKAREQVDLLRAFLPVHAIPLSATMLADPRQRAAELKRGQTLARSSTAPIVVVTLTPERASGAARRLADDLASVASAVLTNSRTAYDEHLGVLATGGDTTLALCRALHVDSLWPQGELAPGVPWSRAVTKESEFTLVTKAGGFGGPRVLLEAIQSLTRAAQAAA